MKAITAILSTVYLLSPIPAFSGNGFNTGNDLFALCNDNKPICAGYVSGVADMLSTDGTICVPDNVSVGQTVDIVVKYLTEYPEQRHYSAASEVALALRDVFPCQ